MSIITQNYTQSSNRGNKHQQWCHVIHYVGNLDLLFPNLTASQPQRSFTFKLTWPLKEEQKSNNLRDFLPQFTIFWFLRTTLDARVYHYRSPGSRITVAPTGKIWMSFQALLFELWYLQGLLNTLNSIDLKRSLTWT